MGFEMSGTDRLVTLESFRDSIIVPLKNTDAEKWPIRSGRVVRLVSDCLAEEFFGDIDSLSDRGWNRSEIAELFGTPTRLWRLSHHLLQGLRASSASLLEQQNGILQILGLIRELKQDSAFLKDGANLILNNAEAQSLAAQVVDSDGAAIQWSHRAAAVLWSYAEALYFVAHELGVEIHGPYIVSGDRVLFVRDFFSPRPRELWPELSSFFDFDSLRIAVIYSEFPGYLDVYNNIYVDSGISLPSRALAAGVWVDGTAVRPEDLERVCGRGAQLISKVTSVVDSWSLVEIAARYTDIFWWRKRELALAARGEWRPRPSVIARIVENAIPPASAANPSEDELRRQFDLTGS